jgi:hypothetical protein
MIDRKNDNLSEIDYNAINRDFKQEPLCTVIQNAKGSIKMQVLKVLNLI